MEFFSRLLQTPPLRAQTVAARAPVLVDSANAGVEQGRVLDAALVIAGQPHAGAELAAKAAAATLDSIATNERHAVAADPCLQLLGDLRRGAEANAAVAKSGNEGSCHRAARSITEIKMLLDLDQHPLAQRQAADAGDERAYGAGQLCAGMEAARAENAKVDRIAGAVERQRLKIKLKK